MSPPETSAEDQVRCPHCAATFTLGNALEVSLPRLIRIQQKRQKSDPTIHDTAETIAWPLWAELVVDETSVDPTPTAKEHAHLAKHEVHFIESDPTNEPPFQATATPVPATSTEDDDDSLFDFVIEGEEASKIFSKRELELAAEGSSIAESTSQTGSEGAASLGRRSFDLAFDEALLEEEQQKDHEASDENQQDMFDFEAEAGELEPSEFHFESDEVKVESKKSRVDASKEIPLAKPTEEKTKPVTPRPSTMVFPGAHIDRGRRGRRENRTLLAAIIGIAGLFFMGMAYYGLNFFGGAEYDWFGIPLPGCPHTYASDKEVAQVDPLAEQAQKERQLKERLANLQSTRFAPAGKSRLPESVINRRPIQEETPTQAGDVAKSESGGTSTSENSQPTKTGTLFVNPDIFIPNLNINRPRSEFQLPEGAVGLVSYPLYDVRELEATLTATHEEFGCPDCQSTGYLNRTLPDGTVSDEKIVCDNCMGNPANLMTTTGYSYFCQLGQAVTLFKDDSPRATQARQQVKELLKKTVISEKEYGELGQLTLARLEKPFHPNEGFMLTGLVHVVKPNKGLYGAIIRLPDSDERITVLSDRPFDFAAEDRVVLLGVVVTDPTKNIAGYDASKPWVVWYGDSVTLPQPLPQDR